MATNPNPELPGSGTGVRTGLARVYRSLNQPQKAIEFYKQAVTGVEQVRLKIQGLPPQLQVSFLQAGQDGNKRADTYRELADLLLSQGKVTEAQQVLELLKVQEIRDFTSGKTAGGKPQASLTATEQQITKQYGSLIAFGQRIENCRKTQCSELSQLLDRRDALTSEYNQGIQSIDSEVRRRRAQDEGFFDPNKLTKAREIVESQPGTVLVYPFVLPDKIWLLWASKGGIVKRVEVPVSQQKLGETVRKFRELLQNRTSGNDVNVPGKQLYDWLIKPIELELKANKVQNIVFSSGSRCTLHSDGSVV